jgi:hypothetical protein
MSEHLARIQQLQDERAGLWALDNRTTEQCVRLLTIESSLAYLWRLRRAELAGKAAASVPAELPLIGYEHMQRGPGRQKTRWWIDA